MPRHHIHAVSRPKRAQLDEIGDLVSVLRSLLALIADAREVLNIDPEEKKTQ